MKDLIKKSLKIVGVGVIWVFLLSINIRGNSAFYLANDILVQNSLVRTIDEEMASLWDKMCRAGSATVREFKAKKEKV